MEKYKRVLLKLSGEALAGDKKTGFDEETCIRVAKQVKELADNGIRFASAVTEQLTRMAACAPSGSRHTSAPLASRSPARKSPSHRLDRHPST